VTSTRTGPYCADDRPHEWGVAGLRDGRPGYRCRGCDAALALPPVELPGVRLAA